MEGKKLSFGKRLKSLRIKNDLSQQEIADRLNLNRSTYARYELDQTQPDFDTLQKIADFYDVSIDFLLGRENKSLKHETNGDWIPKLNEKDEKDIALRLEAIAQDIESQTSLSFNGEPMDEDTKELVLAQIERNLRLAKQLAKQKFTPKKYRKNKEDDEQE